MIGAHFPPLINSIGCIKSLMRHQRSHLIEFGFPAAAHWLINLLLLLLAYRRSSSIFSENIIIFISIFIIFFFFFFYWPFSFFPFFCFNLIFYCGLLLKSSCYVLINGNSWAVTFISRRGDVTAPARCPTHTHTRTHTREIER